MRCNGWMRGNWRACVSEPIASLHSYCRGADLVKVSAHMFECRICHTQWDIRWERKFIGTKKETEYLKQIFKNGAPQIHNKRFEESATRR